MSRSCYLLFGKYGDVAIRWDAQNDEKVLPVIQNMIDRGVRFFLLNTDTNATDEQPVTQVDQTLAARQIIIPDAELERLHQSGIIILGETVDNDADVNNTVGVAKTAAEVARHDTVAVPPAKGG